MGHSIKNTLVDIEELAGLVTRHDDEKAFKSLFYHLVPKLCNYAAYIIGNKEIAEEIAADVMIKFWNNRKNLHSTSRIKNYFFISAKNLALNYLRDHTKKHFVTLEHSVSGHLIFINDPEIEVLNKELHNVIKDSISALPDKCKMVFQLVKEEQMTYQEVAQLLDIAPKTVENQISKALQRIRDAIEQYKSEGNGRSGMWVARIIIFVLTIGLSS